jgi:hypothetical protein
MGEIKTVRDRLNHVKSDLATLKQPKMGKSHFDSLRIWNLEQEKKVLEEKLVELKNNL